MEKGSLRDCIDKNLKGNEIIYITTEEELKNTYIMHTYTRNDIFDDYNGDAIVVKCWRVDDGICIIIK